MVSEEVGESPFGEFPSGRSLSDVYAEMERDLFSGFGWQLRTALLSIPLRTLGEIFQLISQEPCQWHTPCVYRHLMYSVQTQIVPRANSSSVYSLDSLNFITTNDNEPETWRGSNT